MKQFIIAGAAVVDVLAVDVFETGSSSARDIQMSYGGDALNEAVVLSRLGGKVNLISRVGCDRAGKAILHYCWKNGISTEDIQECEDISTGVNIVMVTEDGERHFVTNSQSTLRKLTMGDIFSSKQPTASHEREPSLGKVTGTIFCLASMFVSECLRISDMEQVFAWAKKQGFLVCADVTKPKHGEKSEECAEALKYLDYFFANRDESAMLTGESALEAIARKLYRNGALHVIIKCGALGCYIYGKNKEGKLLSQYVLPVPSRNCIDTTGAGDSFVAGFLYALSKGKDFVQCAEFGNVCGSLAVEKIGATTWTEDEEVMNKLRMR